MLARRGENVYTAPPVPSEAEGSLLDVAGALERLPDLSLSDAAPADAEEVAE